MVNCQVVLTWAVMMSLLHTAKLVCLLLHSIVWHFSILSSSSVIYITKISTAVYCSVMATWRGRMWCSRVGGDHQMQRWNCITNSHILIGFGYIWCTVLKLGYVCNGILLIIKWCQWNVIMLKFHFNQTWKHKTSPFGITFDLKKNLVCTCVYVYVYCRHHIKYFVIASVVADVQLLHSRLKSWLGHECMFTFLYIVSSCMVVLYLREL